tara:strand:- start:87 stop:467 length:381 start_codon:yes stop_codon:yes gene_type:complete
MAESTAKEKAISKKSDKESISKKLLLRTIIQGITPRVPVHDQGLFAKINKGEDVSINRLKNFAKKYFENLKSAGIETGSRAYKNAQYAAAEAGSYEGKPHKKGGAIKKYAQGGAVSSGHQLTYKRR